MAQLKERTQTTLNSSNIHKIFNVLLITKKILLAVFNNCAPVHKNLTGVRFRGLTHFWSSLNLKWVYVQFENQNTVE